MWLAGWKPKRQLWQTMIDNHYELLHQALLALAAEIEGMHDRYVTLARHDPYLAQAYRISADQLRRLARAVAAQALPCPPETATQLAHKAFLQAMIAAGEVDEAGDET